MTERLPVPDAAEAAVPFEATEPTTRRIEFLDAVRALAALLVVASHFRGSARLDELQQRYVSLGTTGVLAFFLCSGFIIPSSLARSRSPRHFAVGRLLRLWPMYLVSVAAVLLVTHVASTGFDRPVPLTGRVLLANALMLSAQVGEPTIVRQAWTLGFELIFYAGVLVLFPLGLLRRSVPLLAAALATTLGAAVVPPLHDHPYAWRWSFWLATMVVGMVVRDGRTGRLPPWASWAGLGAGLVVGELCIVLGGTSDPAGGDTFLDSLPGTFVAGYGLFAVMLLLAERRWPTPLLRVGIVSYSLYLLHRLVIFFVPDTGIGPLSALVWVGGSIVVAELGFRCVEKPAVRLGRRLVGHPGGPG